MVSLGVTVVSFDVAGAVAAADLWPLTRSLGLSFADRACLALAAEVPNGFAVTADRAWAGVELAVSVRVIR